MLGTIPSEVPTARRYWRVQNWSSESLDSNTLDLTEIRIYEGGSAETEITTGVTLTASFGWTGGTTSALRDGTLSTASRAYTTNWTSVRTGGGYFQFDLGSAKSITGIQFWSLFAQPRLPSSFEVWSSDSASSDYVLVNSVSRGSLTALGGDVHRTEKLSVVTPDAPRFPSVAPLGTEAVWRERAYVYVGGTTPGWQRISTSTP